jgi:hypothetical protein
MDMSELPIITNITATTSRALLSFTDHVSYNIIYQAKASKALSGIFT